jgi:hypothetical protein
MAILQEGINPQLEASMKMTLRQTSIAVLAFACAALFSLCWTGSAEARRLYVSPYYAVNAIYHPDPALSWYAVRAYYLGGPWSGAYYSYAGWSDYAGRYGIACVPGSIVKGGDGI